MQVKCDCCNWWYHLQCINKKMIGKYSMEDVESLEFKGPCCSANGQFNFNYFNSIQLASLLDVFACTIICITYTTIIASYNNDHACNSYSYTTQ